MNYFLNQRQFNKYCREFTVKMFVLKTIVLHMASEK